MVIICIDITDSNMLQEIILIIQSLAATSVRDHLLDLEIWRNISEPAVAAPAAKKRRIGVVPEFKLRKTRKSLGGVVEQFTVDMKETRHLSTLKEAIAVFTPAMTKFQQEHRAYKFQIAVCVVFHRAVDSAVVTQPPVTLTSEMVAVYSDAVSPPEDVNRQLLNFLKLFKACLHQSLNIILNLGNHRLICIYFIFWELKCCFYKF